MVLLMGESYLLAYTKKTPEIKKDQKQYIHIHLPKIVNLSMW